jgi:hypothetical protein
MSARGEGVNVRDVRVKKNADAWGVRDPSLDKLEAETAVSTSANHKRGCDVGPLPKASKSASNKNRCRRRIVSGSIMEYSDTLDMIVCCSGSVHPSLPLKWMTELR